MERIKKIVLTKKEKQEIKKITSEILISNNGNHEKKILEDLKIFADELPRRVRKIFYDFKIKEKYFAILVKNAPFFEKQIPKTPSDYREVNKRYELIESDIVHCLFCCLLGEPYGFLSQRNGSVFNTIIPKEEFKEVPNSSSGSKYDFEFHTEDGFHEAMPDYICLACLKNREKVPTILSFIRQNQIPGDYKNILFENRFLIKSNPIHENVGEQVNNERKSILFGNFDTPYLRININSLDISEYEGKTKDALEFLLKTLNENQEEIVLRPRNCLYIDNFRVVHKRPGFSPILTESDRRWLTRIVTTNDLRKTAHLRTESSSRVIKTH
jgi:predicted Zn-ribbon and HTH transcriptional regulator